MVLFKRGQIMCCVLNVECNYIYVMSYVASVGNKFKYKPISMTKPYSCYTMWNSFLKL